MFHNSANHGCFPLNLSIEAMRRKGGNCPKIFQKDVPNGESSRIIRRYPKMAIASESEISPGRSLTCAASANARETYQSSSDECLERALIRKSKREVLDSMNFGDLH